MATEADGDMPTASCTEPVFGAEYGDRNRPADFSAVDVIAVPVV
jgi:hypothetical protein